MKRVIISSITTSAAAMLILSSTALANSNASPANPIFEERSANATTVGYHNRVKAKQKRYRSYGFPRKRPATGNRVFIFSPRMLMWAAYDANGNLVRTGRASGGSGYCRDIRRSCRTPAGVYSIRSKGGPGCRSTRYPLPRGGAPMPYCMFYSKYYAVHGSPHVPGYNASHGCIRVLPSDARWLSHNFMTIGTTVIVKSY